MLFSCKKVRVGTCLGGVIAASLRCQATSGHIRWRGDRKFHLPFPHSLCHAKKEEFARQECETRQFDVL